jgi:hypothetical protein
MMALFALIGAAVEGILGAIVGAIFGFGVTAIVLAAYEYFGRKS